MAIKIGALSSSNRDPEMESILDQNKSRGLLEPLLASRSLRSGKSYRELWFSLCMNRALAIAHLGFGTTGRYPKHLRRCGGFIWSLLGKLKENDAQTSESSQIKWMRV